MSSSPDLYYYLAPGVDVVSLEPSDVLFRSDTLAIRVGGRSATFFAQDILPLLDGKRALRDLLALIPEIDPEDLAHDLNRLVEAGVLRRSRQPLGSEGDVERATAPFLAMVENLGLSGSEIRDRLQQLEIAIVGLEAQGAHLAALLAQYGAGRLVLLDPYPTEPGNLSLTALLPAEAIGVPRQEALKTALGKPLSGTEIVTAGDEISAEAIAALGSRATMLAGCFDKGFISTNYWLNRAGLEHNKPVIYGEVREHTGLIGPLVLPGQSACYMCYRMRSVANSDDYEVAMNYEEFLDGQKKPALHRRPALPVIPAYVAAVMATEMINLLLGLSQPTLADRVLTFNALTLEIERHPVLQKPDCPVCGLKKKWVRAHPDDAGLLEASEPRGDLLAAAPQLISDRTGIIRRFQWVPRELTNPALPYVVRAELGNHEFRAGEHKEDAVCSGKGLTVEAAEISALGEAVERYSSSIWVPEEVLFAPRRDLDGAALDPRDLVLYRPEQYEHLPYLPYRDDARIGWVRARSLVSGGDILVPATAAFMNYHSPHEQPIAQVTSNGLATGPTLLEAVLSAAEEVLERDAFVITWLNRLKTRRVDPRTHPHRELVEYTEAYHRRGVELELYLLPTDHPWHVFMALGVQVGEGRDGPAVVVGLGADLDARQAARQALLEVGQVRPALRRRLREPKNRERLVELLEDPRRVAVLEDHDLLYAAPGAMHAFDFLRQQPITPFSWDEPESGTPQSRLSLLLDTLRSQEGGDLIYYNLTPPDMAPFHLYTVRAILPGYQPIHFGWNQRRLAGRRLYDLSYRLGQRPAPTTVAELNPDPHPLP